MPFRDVAGHRRLVTLLARSVRRETLPPSLIFAGPAGIGKRLVATATAQALNCGNPSSSDAALELDACGTCAACRRIARGVHPDVLIVEPGESGTIKIDQVRDIVDRAAYRPFEGRRRVVIFDEADSLVSGAQHALLKTLEEPPPSSILILITSRPDLLLPTVLSRCPRLRFRPLDSADVALALTRLGKDVKEARALAATADGRVRRALEASAGEMIELRRSAARVLAEAAATVEPKRRLEAAKDLVAKGGSAGDREELKSELRAMASLVRDVELLAASGDSQPLANHGAGPELERLSAFRGARGIHAFEAIDRALEALDRNAGVKIVADWLVLQL